MVRITKQRALEILRKHDGTIFGAVNVKENGETRNWNVRLHCGKAAEAMNRTGRKVGENHDPFKIKVFEVSKRQFRTLNIRTVLFLRVKGVDYQIVNPEIAPLATVAKMASKESVRKFSQSEFPV